jgi:transposase
LERIPRQFYTQEFKEEAVQLVVTGGLSIAEVGRRLSLSPQTLRNWINNQQAGKLKVPGSRSISELEAEVFRLRRELAETRLEKEILKKAMAYLVKEPRGGTR